MVIMRTVIVRIMVARTMIVGTHPNILTAFDKSLSFSTASDIPSNPPSAATISTLLKPASSKAPRNVWTTDSLLEPLKQKIHLYVCGIKVSLVPNLKNLMKITTSLSLPHPP